jgi:hypothetical protein
METLLRILFITLISLINDQLNDFMTLPGDRLLLLFIQSLQQLGWKQQQGKALGPHKTRKTIVSSCDNREIIQTNTLSPLHQGGRIIATHLIAILILTHLVLHHHHSVIHMSRHDMFVTPHQIVQRDTIVIFTVEAVVAAAMMKRHDLVMRVHNIKTVFLISYNHLYPSLHRSKRLSKESCEGHQSVLHSTPHQSGVLLPTMRLRLMQLRLQ